MVAAARHCLVYAAALTYFDDAEQDPPLNLLAPAPWDEVKRDLTIRVQELVAAG